MLRDAAEPELAQVQRTLLAQIGGRHDPANLRVGWIAGAHAREQIAVYRRMYAQRLTREIAREYPATRALLGAERFDRVARRFAARRRSRSFTLEGYADDFPIFLVRSSALRGPSRDAAVALARYERARARALRAESARLCRFEFDVETAWRRFARGERILTLRRRRTFVAMFRRVAVASLRIPPREVALLRALLRGEGLERAVTSAHASGLRPARIRAAFERWVGAGLLRLDPALAQETR